MTVEASIMSKQTFFFFTALAMKTLEAFPDSLEKLHEAEEIRTVAGPVSHS